MNIAITGGSGFIGTVLTKKFIEGGHRVTAYDKTPPRLITDTTIDQLQRDLINFVAVDFLVDPVPQSIAEHDAIIHLAGVSIYNRWTKTYQQQILDSRVKSTLAIVEACKASTMRPSVFVCASAVGYYGDQGDLVLDETAGHAPAASNDFLSQVCTQWESAAAQIDSLGIRRVSIRTAIVLDPGGGMLGQLVPVFKWGLGGILGNGRQWFSWIHIDDLVSVYYEAVTNAELYGPINAAAPEPVTNREFTKVFASTLRRPAWFRIPGWVLRIVLGPFARAVLSSQRVIPARLTSVGFQFTYPNLALALAHIFTRQ